MEGWQVAVVVLLAILVGASIPVLVQLMLTLRAAGRFFGDTVQRTDRILDQANETLGRVNRALSGAETFLRIGAAAAPAIFAAVRAWRGPSQEAEAPADGQGQHTEA